MLYQGFQTIFSTTRHLGFKVWNFLNQLWNERPLLWHHESFHQICQNIIFYSLKFLDRCPKYPSISSCIWPTIRNPSLTSSNTSFAVNNNKNVRTNTYFYCPSHNYPFKVRNFCAMVWGPHFHLGVFIQLYNEICLVKDMWRAHFEGGFQTTFWTHKLEFLQNSKKLQQWPKCKIEIIRPQLIRILCISIITVTMSYHTCQHNGQLSKATNHFVHHL